MRVAREETAEDRALHTGDAATCCAAAATAVFFHRRGFVEFGIPPCSGGVPGLDPGLCGRANKKREIYVCIGPELVFPS